MVLVSKGGAPHRQRPPPFAFQGCPRQAAGTGRPVLAGATQDPILTQLESALPEAPPQHRRAPIGVQHKPRAREARQEGKRHPFSGRKGSAARDRYAATLFVEQHGQCRMCAETISPTLRGRSDQRDAVVDHIRPWRLRPDLAHDAGNLQLICRRCHARCDGIEKRYWPDADKIANAKRQRQRAAIGVDGWPAG